MKKLPPNHIPEIITWWLDGMGYLHMPDELWCNYVFNSDHVHVFYTDTPDGIAAYNQTDVVEGIAYVMIATNPDMRRQGYASQHLRKLATHLEQSGASKIVAEIEIENTASIALFRSLGYVQVPSDEPAFVRFEMVL